MNPEILMMKSIRLGIVVIGLNEGERLIRCLDSISGLYPVVYVDSGSTDGSIEFARRTGIEVVELDRSIPFTAARARNQGFKRISEILPNIDFVQFVDGDCEIILGWFDTATSLMREERGISVVCGRLRERFPEHSIYNRLCDIEWNKPAGEVTACGGIAMYRVTDFIQVGGFDPSVAAGEEPELCARLRQLGGKIYRMPNEMALHDAAISHFSQWWRRAVRSGYGGMDVAVRFEKNRGGGTFSGQLRNARLWCICWPLFFLLSIAMGWLRTEAMGIFCGIGISAIPLIAQIIRMAIKIKHRGVPTITALAYGASILIAKCASVLGQCRWINDHHTEKDQIKLNLHNGDTK
jgi:glycosyltransferase involved in cell wall biosynthesis